MATAHNRQTNPETLIRKIRALPVARIVEVEEFVDFLSSGQADTGTDDLLRQSAAKVSAPSFAVVWNNPGDDVYNGL